MLLLLCLVTASSLGSYVFITLYLAHVRRQYRHLTSPPLSLSLCWFLGHVPDVKRRFQRNPDKCRAETVCEYLDEARCDMVVLFFFTANTVVCRDINIFPKIVNDRSRFLKSEFFRDSM